MFEGGEKAFHHSVIPATALGRHAAADLAALQQLPVGRSPVLAALVRVDQELLRFDLAVPKSPVEGFQDQGGLHGGAHSPADHSAAVQIDPDSEVPPAAAGADVGDVTGPAAVGCRWVELLLEQVLSHSGGLAATVAAWPESAPGLGLECRQTHEPGDTVPAHQATGGPQFLMDPRGTVEAAVLLEHRCHLSGDGSVLLGPWARVLLPLPPGIEAAAGHTQLAAEPGNGEALTKRLDQAKPLGGSCSFAKCAAASLKKSFSLRSSRFSWRSRVSSARSSVVSWPWSLGPKSPRSMRNCLTHLARLLTGMPSR